VRVGVCVMVAPLSREGAQWWRGNEQGDKARFENVGMKVWSTGMSTRRICVRKMGSLAKKSITECLPLLLRAHFGCH